MNLIERIKKDEGFSATVYKCPSGFSTIAYGYNLDANPLRLSTLEIAHAHTKGMPQHEGERLLKLMIDNIEKDLSEKLSFWADLDSIRKDVLINMAYNLGVVGLLKFKMTLNHIGKGEYTQAADCMIKSLWAKQVKSRAVRLARLMEFGV
jgi:lysozyme